MDIINPTRRLQAHKKPVTCVAFAHNARFRLVSGSEDATARLWDVKTGKQTMWYEGHTGTITGMAWTHDDKSLITGSRDGTVRTWDVESGRLQRVIDDFGHPVIGLWLMADGKRFVTFGEDGTIRLLDLATGEEECRDGTEGGDRAFFDVASSGLYVAHTHQNPEVIQWYQLPDPRISGWSDEAITSLLVGHEEHDSHDVLLDKILCDPRRIGAPEEFARLPEAHLGEPIFLRDLSVNSDSQLVAMAVTECLDDDDEVQTQHCIIVKDGDEKWKWTAHPCVITSTKFSPRSSFSDDPWILLASGAQDGGLRLWLALDSALLCECHGHNAAVHSIAFTPDERILASGGDDSTILLWEVPH